MKILFINQCYWPDHAATAQILTDLSEELVSRDHIVSVVCSREHYDGKGASLPSRDCHNGVNIYRVAAIGGGKRATVVGRILGFLSFYAMAMLKCLRLPKPDVVVTLTSPPMLGLLAWLLTIFKRTKHVHWCMDLCPDALVAHGMIREKGTIHRILVFLTRRYIKSSDAVFVLGTHMGRRIQKYGIDDKHLYIVPVWADGKKISPIVVKRNWFTEKHKLTNKFVVMHSGNMGMGSSFDLLIQAATELRNDNDIIFLFIGGGAQLAKLQEVAQSKRLDNVLFLPYQDREHLSYSLSAGDIHIITLKAGLEGMKVPCKTYGIIAVGKPIIYIGGDESEVADLVHDNNIGFVISDGDVDCLIAAIQKVKSDPAYRRDVAKQAREVFESKYDAKVVISRFEKIMTQVVQ